MVLLEDSDTIPDKYKDLALACMEIDPEILKRTRFLFGKPDGVDYPIKGKIISPININPALVYIGVFLAKNIIGASHVILEDTETGIPIIYLNSKDGSSKMTERDRNAIISFVTRRGVQRKEYIDPDSKIRSFVEIDVDKMTHIEIFSSNQKHFVLDTQRTHYLPLNKLPVFVDLPEHPDGLFHVFNDPQIRYLAKKMIEEDPAKPYERDSFMIPTHLCKATTPIHYILFLSSEAGEEMFGGDEMEASLNRVAEWIKKKIGTAGEVHSRILKKSDVMVNYLTEIIAHTDPSKKIVIEPLVIETAPMPEKEDLKEDLKEEPLDLSLSNSETENRNEIRNFDNFNRKNENQQQIEKEILEKMIESMFLTPFLLL
jgi:hypothetical protein